MKVLEILLLVVMPLAWGLGVEYLFRWMRRKRTPLPPPNRGPGK